MITVSNAAKEHAAQLIKEENRPADTFIRVGVEGGGCSGLMYNLIFDNQMKEGDQEESVKQLKADAEFSDSAKSQNAEKSETKV